MRKALLGKKIVASEEHKWIICKTCGRATDRLHCRHNDSLRTITGKPKTYSRIVKYSKKWRTKYRKKECSQKEIYYSYDLLECISKHHKLSVRRAPFYTKGLTIVC